MISACPQTSVARPAVQCRSTQRPAGRSATKVIRCSAQRQSNYVEATKVAALAAAASLLMVRRHCNVLRISSTLGDSELVDMDRADCSSWHQQDRLHVAMLTFAGLTKFRRTTRLAPSRLSPQRQHQTYALAEDYGRKHRTKLYPT